MYKNSYVLVIICFFVISLLIGIYISHVSENDRQAYLELLENSTPTEQPIIGYFEQRREQVCKEIWYQDTSPLYFRVESNDSQLFFFHRKKGIEVIEQLETIHCIMQEKLYYDEELKDKPMQLTRYIEAKHATYNYNTQLFIAEEVQLHRYRLEGHKPILDLSDQKPIMSGTADSIHFTIEGKQLDFHAQHLRATFNLEEKLIWNTSTHS